MTTTPPTPEPAPTPEKARCPKCQLTTEERHCEAKGCPWHHCDDCRISFTTNPDGSVRQARTRS